MKISYTADGGFAPIPALQAPFEVDTDDLDSETARGLEQCVNESNFFDAPATQSVPPKGADLRTYSITIDNGTRTQTVQLSDPLPPGPLGDLVSRLNAIRRPGT